MSGMGLREFHITLEPGQPPAVTVDGEQVDVDAVRLEHLGAQQLPLLSLYSRAHGTISGTGVVRHDDPARPADQLGVFLSAIDAQLLERTARDRLDFDDEAPAGLTAAMLRQLHDWYVERQG